MKPAVDLSKVPVSVGRVNKVDQCVEGSHGGVGESQVQKEVVGDGPHPLVTKNDPNYDQVAEDSHCHHGDVCQGPERDAPCRLRELVSQDSGCGRGGGVGAITFRGHSPVGPQRDLLLLDAFDVKSGDDAWSGAKQKWSGRVPSVVNKRV